MLVIYSKKTDYNTKINEIEKKIADHNHEQYITTPEFNKKRLKQANLASKSDIAKFVNKTDVHKQVKYVTSNKNELNELLKKVEVISTVGLKKDLIDKLSSLNGAKYFSSGILQLFSIYTSYKLIKCFHGTLQIYS